MNLKILGVIIVIIVVPLTIISFQDKIASENTVDYTVEKSDFKPSDLTVMETNGIKHIIPLDKIKGGGPPKDGIPSIDNPIFANVQESNFMSDSDTVIGLEINGEAKAYPLFILVWHEIVNDRVGGVPVAVTYCPYVIPIKYLRE